MLPRSECKNSSWIRDELSTANFNDERLADRFWFLAEDLFKHPSYSINHASSDWAAAKAAYRFFENSKVTPENILSPHFESTKKRVLNQKRVVIVQDSSQFDFTQHQKTTGLGVIATRPNGFQFQGIWLHTSLALTDQGLPLGLIDHQLWMREKDRDGRDKIGSHQHHSLPIEKKESFKWIKSLRAAAEKTENIPVVMVADREADLFNLFDEGLDYGIDVLVRVRYDRILHDEELDYIKISDRLALEDTKTSVEISVPGCGRRQARKAVLEMKYIPVTLSAHGRGPETVQTRNRHDLDLYLVELRERQPPKGVEPLHWMLLTTLEVRSRAQALETVRLYKLRWTIEIYFKCLKTGCNVEGCRLGDAKKLKNYISMLSIIAWRILWMTYVNRASPDNDCESVLTRSEWHALWVMKNRRAIKLKKISPYPPQKSPTVYEALRWLAGLGGFLARKSDGEPGMITIWRGWLELTSATIMYEALSPHIKKEKPTAS